MATVFFPFYMDCPVVEVNFCRNDGAGTVRRRLLIDSGFTGRSAFALSSSDEKILVQRPAPDSDTEGALQGRQRRIWVICELPELQFQDALLAICTNLSTLALPNGIHGMAGLTFLRCFNCWGGERRSDGEWYCFLETA
ncbi:hypothetical protein FJZ31_08235 [Candidatus Poribacteria bacterium]|nr:hypothetical protein [Candidatus Poribacteria bacterium]